MCDRLRVSYDAAMKLKTPAGKGRRDKERSAGFCPYCEREVDFCWICRCGFRMCQDCMLENAWGLTCNNITWVCPDCGEIRTY